jgi:hypothetical protein
MLKGVLLILLLISAVFSIPKENLPINLGNYDLQALHNEISYSPVPQKNIVSDLASGIATDFLENAILRTDSGEISYYTKIKITGDKPSRESSVKLQDKGTLSFGQKYPFSLKYGVITLGNTFQQFQFAIVPTNGFINTIYFDQNCDNVIDPNEEFHAIETTLETIHSTKNVSDISEKNGFYNSYQQSNFYIYSSQVDNIPVTVKYHESSGTIINQTLFLSFKLIHNQDSEPYKNPKIRIQYQINSYFSGNGSFFINKHNVDKKFLLVDKNNNGIFNEFNKDSIFTDLNNDGILEEYKLKKFYKNHSLSSHTNLLAFPNCLIITDHDNPSNNLE